MENSQRGTNSGTSNAPSASSLMPNVLFREIHKNAFLKRHSSDRRTGFPRKSEKVWVVFCVHDDIEPFLEIYPDQKVALTHKPEWFASLSNVLHVSPTICGHEDEFEFAVTLSFQVVRLSAPSWESMMEWVETIRNKLRELKVLCPKENLYSKMPEQKQPLLPTRDPNSPLPLPPEGPSTLLPGVEIVHLDTRNTPPVNNSHQGRNVREGQLRFNQVPERRPCTRKDNIPERDSSRLSHNTTQASELSANSNSNGENQSHTGEVAVNSTNNFQPHKPRSKRATSFPLAVPSTSNTPSSSNITVIEVSTSNTRNTFSLSECTTSVNCDDFSENEDGDDVFLNNAKTEIKSTCTVENNFDEAHYEHVFLPSILGGKPQALSSSDNKPGVSLPSTDQKHLRKTHSTSVMISPNSNNVQSSHEEVATTTNHMHSSNEITSRDKLMINSTCVKIGGNHVSSDLGKNEINEPLCLQIQSKLEKVSISGMIPRIPAKSSKLAAFKPAAALTRDSNLNIIEGKKCSSVSENQHGESSSMEQGVSGLTTGENSQLNNNVGVSSSAYSQVKKIHKIKFKNECVKNEESNCGKMASPNMSKKKVNETQRDNDSDESKKSGNGGRNKSPENKPPQKIIKRSEAGGTNINKEVLSSVTCHSEQNEHPPSIPSTSSNRVESSSKINIKKIDSSNYSNNNPEVEPITATVQPAVGVISVEDIPLIGGHQRRRRRSSSSDAVPASNTSSSRGIGGADRIRINPPLAAGLPSRENHRNEGETRSSGHSRGVPEQNSHISAASQSSRLTLREQQVLQLRKEIMHPGGVRLQLRRKDCTGSIALVDVLNGVWVAGWKQKEHPLLYNAFHIGDQIISIGEVVIRSSAEAQKIIRSSTSLYIEFIIRRVPFGNVFAIQRAAEGQSLGIVQEGNTGEIKDIVPNSLAARQGLTSKTPSCDGLSLTTWFLTEINGRPLNLFFKDNEIRDRLNAVGKEISILVQPHDFIKQIKKQLKNIRSYKDYIVQ